MLELQTRVPRSLQSLKHSSRSYSRGTESSRQHDAHRLGAHAPARDAAGGVGGATEEDGLIKLPPKIELKCIGEPMSYLALWVISIVGLN
jgi:hypothetical protein